MQSSSFLLVGLCFLTMTINVIDFALLRQVLFCGLLTVPDLISFGCVCNKVNVLWKRIMEIENQLGIGYYNPIKLSFLNLKTRAKAETIDEWFQLHK